MDGAPDSAPKVPGSIPRWGDLGNAGATLLLRFFNFFLVFGEPCDLLFLLFPLFAVLLFRRPHPGTSRALNIHPQSFNVVFSICFFTLFTLFSFSTLLERIAGKLDWKWKNRKGVTLL